VRKKEQNCSQKNITLEQDFPMVAPLLIHIHFLLTTQDPVSSRTAPFQKHGKSLNRCHPCFPKDRNWLGDIFWSYPHHATSIYTRVQDNPTESFPATLWPYLASCQSYSTQQWSWTGLTAKHRDSSCFLCPGQSWDVAQEIQACVPSGLMAA